jgi:Uma2 family endonuclease
VATALEIPRKVWTRADAHTLADSGLFPNASKLELINGDLIDHTGKKRPLAIWQKLILVWLQATFGTEYVEMENPIDVAAADNLLNEPEPDLIVTVKNSREYATNPTPEELRLVIEVSDSTLNFDLKVKAPLYARAGILDYWVVDIPNRLVHVHRAPLQGIYASVLKYGFSEDIRPLAKPDAVFRGERL